MKTQYGNATIGNHGYYMISSNTQYHGILLHRLLFMKYWRTDIPKGYFIHHKDGNKLNNCIMNLQLMKQGEHTKLHATGYTHRYKDREKISVSKIGKSLLSNNTGYYRVYKEKSKSYKQGFCYTYEVDESRLNKKRHKKKIRRNSIDKLKIEVEKQGYIWKKVV